MQQRAAECKSMQKHATVCKSMQKQAAANNNMHQPDSSCCSVLNPASFSTSGGPFCNPVSNEVRITAIPIVIMM